MHRREQRVEIVLDAQMRLDLGWTHVWIHNLSAHGMLLWASHPPRPGSYIELRKAAETIISRVVWVREKYFGVRTEALLDIRTLLRGTAKTSAAPSSTGATRTATSQLQAETSPRAGHVPTPLSRLAEFAAITVATAAGAAVMALLTYDFLAGVFAVINRRLTGSG